MQPPAPSLPEDTTGPGESKIEMQRRDPEEQAQLMQSHASEVRLDLEWEQRNERGNRPSWYWSRPLIIPLKIARSLVCLTAGQPGVLYGAFRDANCCWIAKFQYNPMEGWKWVSDFTSLIEVFAPQELRGISLTTLACSKVICLLDKSGDLVLYMLESSKPSNEWSQGIPLDPEQIQGRLQCVVEIESLSEHCAVFYSNNKGFHLTCLNVSSAECNGSSTLLDDSLKISNCSVQLTSTHLFVSYLKEAQLIIVSYTYELKRKSFHLSSPEYICPSWLHNFSCVSLTSAQTTAGPRQIFAVFSHTSSHIQTMHLETLSSTEWKGPTKLLSATQRDQLNRTTLCTTRAPAFRSELNLEKSHKVAYAAIQDEREQFLYLWYSTGQGVQPESWMGDLKQELQSLSLNEIAFLGSHNTGTFTLNDSYPECNCCCTPLAWTCQYRPLLDFGPDMNPPVPCLLGFPPLGQYVTNIIKRWAICQVYSYARQLRDGIRYFDLRPALVQGVFHNTHSMLCGPLSLLIQSLVHFLYQYPDEIVFLACTHIHGVTANAHHSQLIDLLTGNQIEPFIMERTEHLELHEIWKTQQRVVVFYPDPSIVEKHSKLWPLQNVTSEWPKCASPEELHEKLPSIYTQVSAVGTSNSDPAKFHVSQIILTPTTGIISTSVLNPFAPHHNLVLLSWQANQEFEKWCQTDHRHYLIDHARILLLDHYHQIEGLPQFLLRINRYRSQQKIKKEQC